ncbi:MAG: Hsp20/alpha crystallin family protein [Deltaproteobacteria bacterium]|nr:Hsp20/alpha crystallin family protein [Deltaproteobacteria bacterium]
MSTQLETQDTKSVAHRIERASNRPVLVPAVDINESNEEIVLTADMAGIDESSIDITLENDVLTIEGHMPTSDFAGYNLGLKEFSDGDYRRVFTLATDVDRDRISANVKNGVLRLTLPKAEPAKAKKIAVKAG